MKTFPALLVFCLVCGCSSTSHVLVGTKRPPIDPALVQLYLEPPAQYERIAILDASSEGSWAFSGQAKMNAAMVKLKREAAKLGANGILVGGTGRIVTGSVGSGFAAGHNGFATGTSYQAGVVQKTAGGIAIYVPDSATNAPPRR
jgi:hypothetical protein